MAAVAGLRESVESEAREARRAAASLTDEAVASALEGAAALVRERRTEILAANEADCEAAAGRIDEGMLDRLRLDDARVESLAEQVEAVAGIEPLEREIGSWTLENGLRVSERRIPIGTVGANFEARPNVALDVAGQLLKSLNTAVLRTGGAALGTVTVLVDDVLRPALESAGLPPGAVGLVRSPDREGARILVDDAQAGPARHPARQRRDDGGARAPRRRATACGHSRTRRAAACSTSTAAADRERALAIAEASLDRLGRLQPAQPRARRPRRRGAACPTCWRVFREKGLEVRGTPRAVEAAGNGVLPHDRTASATSGRTSPTGSRP